MTEPFQQGKHISVISAMGTHGVCAPLRIEGAINSEVFDLYVEHLLAPCLRPGNIVFLDNVKFHYSPKAIVLMEAAGARVRHLPAYSPDFNPLEAGISKIRVSPKGVERPVAVALIVYGVLLQYLHAGALSLKALQRRLQTEAQRARFAAGVAEGERRARARAVGSGPSPPRLRAGE
jgi:transposase